MEEKQIELIKLITRNHTAWAKALGLSSTSLSNLKKGEFKIKDKHLENINKELEYCLDLIKCIKS